MNYTVALFAACCALTFAQPSGAAQRVLDKTFQVDAGGTLTVEAQGGDIEVTGSESDRVVVHVVVNGSASVLENAVLTAEQSGDDVTIIARRSSRTFSGWFGSGDFSPKVTVSVPHRYHVQLKTSGGDLMVANLEGDATGTTSGGDVEVTDITGPVRMRTSGGDVKIERIEGDAFVRTSGGSIRAQTVNGDLDAVTSGGGIQIEEINGAVVAHTSSGTVVARRVTGSIDLESSGGDIRAEEIDGTIRAGTSGGNVSVDLRGANRGIVTSTSGGNITVRVPHSTGATLDAATSGGSVTSDLPVTMTDASRSKLRGTINGGGEAIRARTSGGSIRLQAREAA